MTENIEEKHEDHDHVHKSVGVPDTEKIIEIENLCVSYKNSDALTDVTFDIYRGEFLGIIGPNGGGKTTLLKAMLGLIKASRGEVRIFGEKPTRARGKIGYVPQFSLVDRSFPITVSEVVMSAFLGRGIHPFRAFSDKEKERAKDYLRLVNIDALSERRVSELSGGEFQRLLIARAVAMEPEILILDEPTASVDPVSRNIIYDFLAKKNAEGMTIIMVTHDMMAISSSVGRIACLNGRLDYHGEPSLTEEVLNEMYGCPIDLIAHGVPHRVLGEHTHTEGHHHD